MNHKQLLALFLFLVIIASSSIINLKSDVVKVKDVTSNIDEFKIENINEEDDKKQVNIFYPVTNYQNVNEKILKKIELYKNKFEEAPFTADKKYLEISFDEYEYNGYVSFKFNVKSNTGITHDLNEVFTIVYKDEEIIDIDYLIKKDNKILETLETECKVILKENERIKEFSTNEWISKGLEKSKENYDNFIFTENSLVIIFNEYTVAPYVAGMFEVEISYDKFNLNVD